jgi:hypothetical protein
MVSLYGDSHELVAGWGDFLRPEQHLSDYE